MSDEQTNQQPDTSAPSPERQVELEAAYERQQHLASPYAGVAIRTLGELQWILQRRRWSSEYWLPKEMERANFSYANFQEANLGGAKLGGANLQHARLDRANLSGGNFDEADLSQADIRKADLSNTILWGANLSGARLTGAYLKGSRLERAVFSAETVLDEIKLDKNTRFAGVRWSAVSLDAISWEQIPILGDELRSELHSQSRNEKIGFYRDATRAYHGLVVALHNQGLNEPATNYRLREMAMQRKTAWNSRKFGVWLLNSLFGILGGHGEKPLRAFFSYTVVVASFAAIFWAVTNFIHTHVQQPLQWYEAIVLSLSSFHGRGFFTNTISLGDPLAIVGALEAMMGLFIELIFIATFSRRFLGD